MSIARRSGGLLLAALIAGDAESVFADDTDSDADTEETEEAKEATQKRSSRKRRKPSFADAPFYSDKADTDETRDGTLIQGSLTTSAFYYAERGGTLAGAAGTGEVTSHSPYSRMFTEARAQLDARHLSGGRFDVRLDVRGRLVGNPGDQTNSTTSPGDTRVQSGNDGRREIDLRELWLARAGERTDWFFGRQFAADLAIKFDGLRIDYAKSDRWTLLGIAGTAPARGSRSIGTDYPGGESPEGTSVGRVIPAVLGGGGAYRTERTYGSLGAVGVVPMKGESPRFYVTSNGYARFGPKVDLYHLAVVDLHSASGAALTNVSVGALLQPHPRLSFSPSVHHIDTETLSLVAQAQLDDVGVGGSDVVRNDTVIRRTASDEARAGLSLALGSTHQLELSTRVAYRRRPEFNVAESATINRVIPSAKGLELGGSVTHRDLGGYRVALDVSRTSGVGGTAFARNQSTLFRLSGNRTFARGRGEWEASGSYLATRDDTAGNVCGAPIDINQCFGFASMKVIEANGQIAYRVGQRLLIVASLGVSSQNRTAVRGSPSGAAVSDPAVLGLASFLRISYRF